LNNVIIGTAGHIDHGKTTLIKALTGRNTDRLKEEQQRGISIELGFTFFDLPDGRRAGIIDVPGHEKFVKHMLAGVSGMDLVLLVVAADEGVMPQTREHLDILQLANVKKGIVVLTKVDMVEDEWLQLVEEDVKGEIKGTFLEGAPVVFVSSTTGSGIEGLVKLIEKMTKEVEKRSIQAIFRLPIDRVFTITGFGTIVTGTLISGKIEEGQKIMVYPGGIEGRVRNLQVHDKDVKTAYAGQRVAVNLAGIKRNDVSRGDVLAPSDALVPTMMLDCNLMLLKTAPRPLANRDRVRLYIGTSEILCRVILLDREELEPGQSCYVQLRLEEETVAFRGDRLVIRTYSPMQTIGGGVVLESNPPKRKRFKDEVVNELKVKETGSPTEVVEKVLNINSKKFPEISEMIKLTGMSREELMPNIEKLVKKNEIIAFTGGGEKVYIHKDYYLKLKTTAHSLLDEFHIRYILRGGMPVEELRRKLFGDIKGTFIDQILKTMEKEKVIKIQNNLVSLYNFEIVLTEKQKQIKTELIKILKNGEFSTPSIDEIVESFKNYNQNEIVEVLDSMVEMGEVKRLKENVLFLKEYYDKAVNLAVDYIKQNEKINLATFRDMLNTSRKYAIALLEEMDRQKITKRSGDYRILYK